MIGIIREMIGIEEVIKIEEVIGIEKITKTTTEK